MSRCHAFDIIVVGAGPAGLAAATSAAEASAKVGLLDDNLSGGGQIWRGEASHPTTPAAAKWLRKLAQSDVELFPSTRVIDVEDGELLAANDAETFRVRYAKLIVATGARELFLPFPGWTLPHVVGVGALQALVKSGHPIADSRVVVAGTGPLLWACAAYLSSQGARVALIAEQVPQRRLTAFGMQLVRWPGTLLQAADFKRHLADVPFRTDCWPVSAHGDEQVTSVTLTDGTNRWSESCDYLACSFGLVPNLELPLRLGCRATPRALVVNETQETTVRGIYGAGEVCSIGGLKQALVQGRIAGYAATDQPRRAHSLKRAHRRARRFARLVNDTFELRDELRMLPDDDTMICRCEDITWSQLRTRTSWRDARLQTRCGMGSCQGRICGPAVDFLRGWQASSVRPPVFPARVSELMELYAQTKEH
jgi:NADPH-dependent 2,4-dienoyl-CoA reductase/sulfur reductase-like enzyme